MKPWSVRRRRRDEVIFVLGAGASVDAGLPTAAELTVHLQNEWVKRVPAAATVLEAINRVRRHATWSSDVPALDYEAVFWWLRTLIDHEALRPLAGLDRRSYDKELFAEMAETSRDIITEHLSAKESGDGDVSYLWRMVEHARNGQAISVFSLNYDTCVERACRDAGIPITTGFDGEDVHRRGWKPALFGQRSGHRGILLHKLHGSLTWFGEDPSMYEDLDPPNPAREKTKWDARPQIILGPGGKEQPDDPFAWLLYRFHRALQRARTCVVIGFGWRDPHVAARLGHEYDLGLDIVNVAPENTRAASPRRRDSTTKKRLGAFRPITSSAADALRGDAIADAIACTRRVTL